MDTGFDPLSLFAQWFDAAKATGIDKPNAMTLSTSTPAGVPSSRIVLLSRFDKNGFVFHTNYLSHKGREVLQNPQVALLFWWDELGYQVRIQGRIDKTSAQASDDYFKGRPRGSQLGAWASAQSEVIASRETLEENLQRFEQKFANQPVPRPAHWGGYTVKPVEIEFWSNRENRLHDRVLYSFSDNQWQCSHLAP